MARTDAVAPEGLESALPQMQTREQLYEHLQYHRYETELDEIQKQEEPPS